MGEKKCTHTHTCTLQKAYLQCRRGVKQSSMELGGRARAAVCEIEALMSPKDSAVAQGEMAK